MKKTRGFSITELMIAVAIFGILIVLIIPQFRKYSENARLKKDGQAMEQFIGAARGAAMSKFANITIRNGNASTAGLAHATSLVASSADGSYRNVLILSHDISVGLADPDGPLTVKPNGTVEIGSGKGEATLTLVTGASQNTFKVTISKKGATSAVAVNAPVTKTTSGGSGGPAPSDPGSGAGTNQPNPAPAGGGSSSGGSDSGGTSNASTSDNGIDRDTDQQVQDTANNIIDKSRQLNELLNMAAEETNTEGLAGTMQDLQSRIEDFDVKGKEVLTTGDAVVNSSAAPAQTNTDIAAAKHAVDSARRPYNDAFAEVLKLWEQFKSTMTSSGSKDAQQAALNELTTAGERLKANYVQYRDAVNNLAGMLKSQN